tara:strand:- start:1916 stop:2110 length:195 start_codon:yes stop_codon:yes gene_type:complete
VEPLRDRPDDDRVLAALRAAAVDDEPESESEAQAAALARAELAKGEFVTQEKLVSSLTEESSEP